MERDDVISDDFSEIKKKIREHEARLQRLEGIIFTKPESVRKKLSIREFILSKKTKNEAQKVMLIAYYLERFENFDSFNIKDLEKGFRDAKEKAPRNTNYEVIRCIQKEYMMEVEEKKDNRKAWCLTNKGICHVENNFGSKS